MQSYPFLQSFKKKSAIYLGSTDRWVWKFQNVVKNVPTNLNQMKEYLDIPIIFDHLSKYKIFFLKILDEELS